MNTKQTMTGGSDNSVTVIYPAWIDVNHQAPPIAAYREKPYVLAVDAKGRMSIGYALPHSTAGFYWVFAKPIGTVTHWMKLPEPPRP